MTMEEQVMEGPTEPPPGAVAFDVLVDLEKDVDYGCSELARWLESRKSEGGVERYVEEVQGKSNEELMKTVACLVVTLAEMEDLAITLANYGATHRGIYLKETHEEPATAEGE